MSILRSIWPHVGGRGLWANPSCMKAMQAHVMRQKMKTMSVDELQQCLADQDHLQVIDVRNREEIEKTGKIKGAMNIPFQYSKDQPDLFLASLSDIDKSTKIVFQCMSGKRSEKVAQIALDQGFERVYNLQGGFNSWATNDRVVQPFLNNHSPWVHTIFDPHTETAQYIVTDLETREAFIIDPVLDYDAIGSCVHPTMAAKILDFVHQHKLTVTKIIDTHVHADHLSAASYLKSKLPNQPPFLMGRRVTQVQETFSRRYNLTSEELCTNGDQFDHLVQENETWTLGKHVHCSVLNTPGHTPACMSYLVGDAAFVGDTLFMPDVGTARCDFPGGSPDTMYNSIRAMYAAWPDDTRIFVGHDYPPPGSGRKHQVVTTLGVQKKYNRMIHQGTSLDDFRKTRQARDKTLKTPRYIHPSLQTNLRGGHLPNPEKSVHDADALSGSFFKIPVKWRT